MVLPRDHRIHMFLSEAELKAIDDWRFANRVATRAEAIRRLCQMALVLDSKLTPIFEANKAYAEQYADFMGHMSKTFPESSSKNKVEIDRIIVNTQAKALNVAVSFSKLQLTIRDVTAKAYALKAQGKIDGVIGDVNLIDTQFSDLISRYDAMAEQLRSDIEGLEDLESQPDETKLD